jgi:hypothetical protein
MPCETRLLWKLIMALSSKSTLFGRIDYRFFTISAFPDKKGLDSAEFRAGSFKNPEAETIFVEKGRNNGIKRQGIEIGANELLGRAVEPATRPTG